MWPATATAAIDTVPPFSPANSAPSATTAPPTPPAMWVAFVPRKLLAFLHLVAVIKLFLQIFGSGKNVGVRRQSFVESCLCFVRDYGRQCGCSSDTKQACYEQSPVHHFLLTEPSDSWSINITPCKKFQTPHHFRLATWI
jgi:hypothetical protein